MRKLHRPERTQPTSTSITLTLSVKRPRPETTLMLATLALLLVTIFSASSGAQTPPTSTESSSPATKCHLERTELAKYRCLALEANADAKKANQAAKDAEKREQDALAREKTATEQRDAFIDELETCQTDRDHASKGEADCKGRNLELEAKVAPLIVDNTLYKAENKKLKRQRWYFAGGALVLGFVLGGGAALYVVAGP